MKTAKGGGPEPARVAGCMWAQAGGREKRQRLRATCPTPRKGATLRERGGKHCRPPPASESQAIPEEKAKAPGAQLPDPAENAKAHEVHVEAEVSTWKVAEEDAVLQHEARAGYLVTTIISRKRVGGAAARQIPTFNHASAEVLGICKEMSTSTDF